MLDLNSLIPEIYKTAVDHGFWEGERSVAEITNLIHSELSEVLEEARNGRKLNEVYYECQNGCMCENKHTNQHKPCGIPVELADVIIRVLDWHGKRNYKFEKNEIDNLENLELNDLIADCHDYITTSYINNETSEFGCDYFLDTCISIILDFCEINSIDIESAIIQKMEYNKNREWKHGKKF